MESFNIALYGTLLVIALALVLSYLSGAAGQTASRSDFLTIAFVMLFVWVVLAIVSAWRRQK